MKRPSVKQLAIGAVAVAIVIALLTLDVRGGFQWVLDRIEALGLWAPVAFVVVYIAATVLLLSAAVLTLGAGALFGLGWGFVWSSLASTAAATVAFLVGRHLARDWVSARVANHARFAAIDRAVADEGWKIVALTRLSPVFPFVVLNYAFGLTRVRLGQYVLASWLAMMPGTLLYVYLGYIARAAAAEPAEGASPVLMWSMRVLGLVATLAVTVVVTRIARRAMNRRVEPAAEEERKDA